MPEKDGKTTAPTTVDDPAADGDQAGNAQTMPPPPEPAPAEPVGEAKRKLEQAKNALADAEDTAKRGGEIEKAILQYRAEQLRLEADEETAKAQLRKGLEELDPTDPEKAQVKKIWDDLNAEKKALAGSIEGQRDELEKKRDAFGAVKKDLVAAKDRFEALKALGKGVQAKHRAAEALGKEAFDAIGRKKRHLADYLLEFPLSRTIDGQPTPIEVAAFIDAINQASRRFGELTAAHRDLEAEIREKEKKLADDEKRLTELQKNFDATIREKLAAQA